MARSRLVAKSGTKDQPMRLTRGTDIDPDRETIPANVQVYCLVKVRGDTMPLRRISTAVPQTSGTSGRFVSNG